MQVQHQCPLLHDLTQKDFQLYLGIVLAFVWPNATIIVPDKEFVSSAEECINYSTRLKHVAVMLMNFGLSAG